MYELGLENDDRVASELGGGFPEGEIVLLTGEDGAGKSVFSQRFTAGFLDAGYTVTYLSPELRAPSFIRQMTSLDYDIRDGLANQQLRFLTADVDTAKRLHGAGRASSRTLLPNLAQSHVPFDSDIVIIDSLDLLINADQRLRDIRASKPDNRNNPEVDAIQNLLTTIINVTNTGTTVIVTVDDSAVPDDVLQRFENKAAVYISLQREQVSGELRKSAVVHRYSRQQSGVNNVISFRVQDGTGVIIESRTVS